MFLKILNQGAYIKVKKKLVLLLLVLAGNIFLVNAQSITSVNGFIRDAVTKRPMPFVTVVLKK